VSPATWVNVTTSSSEETLRSIQRDKFRGLAWFVDHQLLRETEDTEEKGQETAKSSTYPEYAWASCCNPTREISEGKLLWY